MIILAWNCHGLGQTAAVRALRELLCSHRPCVVFLYEIKLNDMNKATKLSCSLGYPNSHCVLAVGASGGLLLLWSDHVHLHVVVANSSLINCLVTNTALANPSPWQLSLVYGPPIPSLRPEFWSDLNLVGDSFAGPWLIDGDFNVVLAQVDKMGGKPVASSSRGGFRGMVDQNGLIDLGYRGYAYTWSNRRAGKENIQERLDWGFANEDWKLLYPNARIDHLVALHFDHRPILIHTSPPTSLRPHPFWFEAMWTRDESAGHIIEDAWVKGRNPPQFPHLMSKLKNTKVALKAWNRTVFGHLQTNIKTLKGYIDHLQSQPSTHRTLKLESKAQQELDELLVRERIL